MVRFACSLVVTVSVAACSTGPADGQPAAARSAQRTGPTSMPTKTGGSAMPPMEGEHHEEHAKASIDREHVDADGVVRRGKMLSSEGEALTVSMVAERASDLSGKTIKVTGKVESVCQAMGCWFVLQGDKPEHRIRITSKGHDIYVPRSAKGMVATVEGEFKIKTLDAKTAQHFEDERELKDGEQRKTFTSDTQELSIAVVGLEMKRPSSG